MSEYFNVEGPNRQASFAIPQHSPEELQNGVGGVPDPTYQAGIPGQKMGPARGDFHVQLEDAETLGRYGPAYSHPNGPMDPSPHVLRNAGFQMDNTDNNC